MQRIPRIGVVSMGCPKALVDSERIMTQLRAEGYDIVGSYTDADLVIVNTCGFLNEAVAESVDAINEAMHENGRVIVTGCLGAKKHLDGTPYLDDVCPDVLGVTGPGEFDKVYELVHKHLPQPHSPYWDLVPKAGLKLTPSHYAYLKISEGCNHRCAFCIIPQLRGKLVSRPIGEVLREAELLREAGVKELMVISQDTSAYGADCRYRIDFNDQGKALQTKLYDLARELGDMGMWIRLHYVYPYPAVDQVVELMADGKILPYLDIPFQHAHPRVLKSMKRPAATEKTLERIQAWRRICPDLTIRSTFIAVSPGKRKKNSNTCWISFRKLNWIAWVALLIHRLKGRLPMNCPVLCPMKSVKSVGIASCRCNQRFQKKEWPERSVLFKRSLLMNPKMKMVWQLVVPRLMPQKSMALSM